MSPNSMSAMNPTSVFRRLKGHFVVVGFELVSGEALDCIAGEKFPFFSERVDRLRLLWSSFRNCWYGVSCTFVAMGLFVC